MVYTHLPSTIMLALIPIPTSLGIAATLLILRSCTNSMDVAPRSAFLAAVVLPHERSLIMGVVNVVKTLSQSLGLAVTGVLAGRDVFWVAFVVAGVLKAGYDLGLLALFLNHQMIEEREGEATSSDEDGPIE